MKNVSIPFTEIFYIDSFSKYSLSFYFVLGTKLYLTKSTYYNDYY